MTTKFTTITFLLLLLCFSFFSACIYDEETAHKKPIESYISTSQATDYQDVIVHLPAAKNVQLIERNCQICHSLRYIEMQPKMPRKTWEKLVIKMQKVYGMPVSDSTIINQMIDYLSLTKGND